MPQPRKPTAVHLLNGSFKTHADRARARENEPMPDEGLGKAPSTLSPEEQKVWRELRKTVSWLAVSDRVAVEIVCRLTAKMRAGQAKPQEYSVLSSLIARLGMTPADRSRVSAPPKTEMKDEWGEFLEPPEIRQTQ